MGENVIVWCYGNGRSCIAGDFCPHLGLYLGPAAGRRVHGGRLVCPFHGFEYDATGHCVATPFADPPRSARWRVIETLEIASLIFAWWWVEGLAPLWNLPADPPDQAGWSNLSLRTLRFPGHPQEATENSIDLGHISYVREYSGVNRIEPMSVDGPYLQSRSDFKSTRRIARTVPFNLDISASTPSSSLCC